jgi:membrane peptidoglycan carboxypeptidase
MEDVNGLGPGYGGTLAAPIWKDFMQKASDGYCGDFAQPKDPFAGVAYHGAHAEGGSDYEYSYSTPQETQPIEESTTSADTTPTTPVDTATSDTPAAPPPVSTSADTQPTTAPATPPAAGGGVAPGGSASGGAGIG